MIKLRLFLMCFDLRKTLLSGLLIAMGIAFFSLSTLALSTLAVAADRSAGLTFLAAFDAPEGETSTGLINGPVSAPSGMSDPNGIQDAPDSSEGESEEQPFEEELEERAVVSPAEENSSVSHFERQELPAVRGEPRQPSLRGLERPPRT